MGPDYRFGGHCSVSIFSTNQKLRQPQLCIRVVTGNYSWSVLQCTGSIVHSLYFIYFTAAVAISSSESSSNVLLLVEGCFLGFQAQFSFWGYSPGSESGSELPGVKSVSPYEHESGFYSFFLQQFNFFVMPTITKYTLTPSPSM